MDEIIDLEKFVIAWAKAKFLDSSSRSYFEKRSMKKDRIRIEVDWTNVNFEPQTEDENLIYDPPVKSIAASPSSLFSTIYRNHTEETQTHHVHADRSTRSICEVEVEHGYCRGMEFGFSISTPEEIASANVGFKKETSVSKRKGEVFEDEISWGIDSEVKVPPKHESCVVMKVKERVYDGKFKLKTIISGRLTVNYYRRKDNALISGLQYALYSIFEVLVNKGIIVANDAFYLDKTSKSICVVCSGKCRFMYSSEQEMEVNHKAINA